MAIVEKSVLMTSKDSSNNKSLLYPITIVSNVDGLEEALAEKANASHGTHVTFSSTKPSAAGTASVGTATTVSRSDHVHPEQTSVSGNAGTATKLKNSRSISLSGDATGSASFDGSANATISATLAASGVTAGSYGPSANASPAHSGTFSVPYITVDAKGRVTSASNKTITLPSDNNTDTKVTNTLATTTKAYVTGTTSATTNTGTQVFDTGVYLDTTAGKLTATTFNGALTGNADTATKLKTARTIALSGSVTGSGSFDGSGNLTISTSTNHTHNIDGISKGTSLNVAGGVSAVNAAKFDVTRACRTAFMPAAAITVEYTQNNGSTWTDYGATDDQKRGLFSLNRGWSAALGKSGTVVVGHGLRITVAPTDRYAQVDNFYCWFSSSGHTCKLKIENSTIGAKTTFNTIRDNLNVNGWSGSNDIAFGSRTFGGSSNQTSNAYAYRFTFMVTSVNSSYTSSHPTVTDLRMYGDNAWTTPNKMMDADHIYSWDSNQAERFRFLISPLTRRVE